jgi:predicted small lipoprotein YifL
LAAARSIVRTLAFGAAVSLALGLAGCGRRGGLDLPPSDTPSPQANANSTQPGFGSSSLMPGASQQQTSAHAPNTVDSQGHPIYQPPPKNTSFILDPVLGPRPAPPPQ